MAKQSNLRCNYLLEEFASRKLSNPSYSMRAFSRDAGYSVGFISEVLSGKRSLTVKSANNISDSLKLPLHRRRIILESVVDSVDLFSTSKDHEKMLLDDDQFRLIVDWYHFAILSLACTKDARIDSSWIANRIGISEKHAYFAIARLVRLGLVANKRGRLVRTSRPVKTSIDVPSHALKESHKQTLQQTIHALYSAPVDVREISSTTIATSPEKIARAKIMSRKFVEKLTDFLEDGPKTEVYNVNFQLVPVTTFANSTTHEELV